MSLILTKDANKTQDMFPSVSMPSLAREQHRTQRGQDPKSHHASDNLDDCSDSPFRAQVHPAVGSLVMIAITPILLRETAAVFRQRGTLLKETIVCLRVVGLRALVLDPRRE